MKISDVGIKAIQNFEGCRLDAYLDVVGVLTIGYGHTGTDVKSGMKITLPEAINILRRDLDRFEVAVSNSLKVPVPQAQFDAMVSLAFNVGAKAFQDSTLLKKLNAGDEMGAACQFTRWSKAGGQFNEGLALRRAAELFMFARGCK